jgi:hypothetical protein
MAAACRDEYLYSFYLSLVQRCLKGIGHVVSLEAHQCAVYVEK